MSNLYKLIITDTSGTKLAEVDTYRRLRFQTVLNKEGDASFTVSLNDPKMAISIVNLRKSELKIQRRDSTGSYQTVWAGYIHAISSPISEGDDIMTVYARGYLGLLEKRVIVSRTFTATDAGQIAKTLIQESQALTNGNLGITYGTIEATQTRDRTYQNQYLMQEIMRLSDVLGGFDFQITVGKQFVVYKQKGGYKFNTVIFRQSYNVASGDYSEDFADGCNRAYVLGAGYGDAMATATVDDTTLQGQYYLMEELLNEKTVSVTSTLQAHGAELILQKGVARREYVIYQIPTTYPTILDVETGDWIRLAINKGRLQIYDVVRIKAIETTVEQDLETNKYTFLYY